MIDIIDVDGDTRFEGQRVITEANAAHEGGGGGTPTGAERCDHRIRYEGVKVERAQSAARFQRLSGDGGNGQWRALQILLPESRRDDDFLKGALRLDWCRGRRA